VCDKGDPLTRREQDVPGGAKLVTNWIASASWCLDLGRPVDVHDQGPTLDEQEHWSLCGQRRNSRAGFDSETNEAEPIWGGRYSLESRAPQRLDKGWAFASALHLDDLAIGDPQQVDLRPRREVTPQGQTQKDGAVITLNGEVNGDPVLIDEHVIDRQMQVWVKLVESAYATAQVAPRPLHI